MDKLEAKVFTELEGELPAGHAARFINATIASVRVQNADTLLMTRDAFGGEPELLQSAPRYAELLGIEVRIAPRKRKEPGA